MKIGCCTNFVAVGKDRTGIELVEQIAQFGYDYVEMPLAPLAALSDGEFANVMRRVEQSGIRCESCSNFFPSSMRLTGPEVDDAKVMAYVEKALARAHAMGAQYVVFGSGDSKRVPDGFPLEEGYRQVVALLKKIGLLARANSVIIVIEPLRRAECNLINSFAEGCRLAKDAGDENIQMLIDYYHFSEEHDSVRDLIDQGRGCLHHAHFARTEGRGYPAGIDEENYLPFINALKTLNYNERISVEGFSSDFAADAQATLKFMKAYFQ